jgi:glutathionylspermidine synthase
METAIQAGYDVKHVYLEDIAKTADGQLLDQDNCYIDTVFKLYPWEWMMREDFQTTILTSHTKFIEPLWKSVLSNKGILPILWDMFPNHPNLLPAYFTPNHGMQNFVKKPLFSREGANIEVYRNGILTNSGADQDYGGEGHIYQQLVEIPKMDDRYPLIGSWVIGGAAGGMGIRESKSLITDNMGHFVPHYFIE